VPKFKTNHQWSCVSSELVSKCLEIGAEVSQRLSWCRSVLWPKCPVTIKSTKVEHVQLGRFRWPHGRFRRLQQNRPCRSRFYHQCLRGFNSRNTSALGQLKPRSYFSPFMHQSSPNEVPLRGRDCRLQPVFHSMTSCFFADILAITFRSFPTFATHFDVLGKPKFLEERPPNFWSIFFINSGHHRTCLKIWWW